MQQYYPENVETISHHSNDNYQGDQVPGNN